MRRDPSSGKLTLAYVVVQWVFDSIGAMQLEDDDKYGLSTASFDADE